MLILDESTRVLAPQEVDALFQVFAALKADGYTILFITHKLREVIRCADRTTVMRDGRIVGRFTAGQVAVETLVATMFGEPGAAEPSGDPHEPRAQSADGHPTLELRGVSARAVGSETPLKNINLRIGPERLSASPGSLGRKNSET